jgi:hypothetical protein
MKIINAIYVYKDGKIFLLSSGKINSIAINKEFTSELKITGAEPFILKGKFQKIQIQKGRRIFMKII